MCSAQYAAGEAPWALATGLPILRAYRSRLDGSVQPYGVTLPAAFGKEPGRKWRLDVVLHGRNTTLTEVKFLKDFMGDKAALADLGHVRIDIFGRGNNAYRWAGEADVTRVDISTDGGATWNAAQLGKDHAKYAWRQWSYDWNPSRSGDYVILSRATDSKGRVQPNIPVWNPFSGSKPPDASYA